MPQKFISQLVPTGTEAPVSGKLLRTGLKSEMVTSNVGDSQLKITNGAEFALSNEQNHVGDDIFIEKQQAREEDLKMNEAKLWVDSNATDSTTSNSSSTNTTPDVSSSNSSLTSCRGPQPTSNVHNFQNNPEFSTCIIPSELYPEKYKLPHYDGLLICSDSEPDRRMAKNFKLLVERFLKLDDDRTPRICMIDEDDGLETIQDQFEKFQEAMNRSTLFFLLMTEDFVKESSANMLKDEALKLLTNKPGRRHSVIPLDTKPKDSRQYEYPFGLRGIKGLDLWKMLKKHDLRDVDVDEIELCDLDEDFCKRLTSLFNRWLSHMQKRIRQQEEELNKWIQEKTMQQTDSATYNHPTNSNEGMKQLAEKMQEADIEVPAASRAVAREGLIVIKNDGNLQIGTNNIQHGRV